MLELRQAQSLDTLRLECVTQLENLYQLGAQVKSMALCRASVRKGDRVGVGRADRRQPPVRQSWLTARRRESGVASSWTPHPAAPATLHRTHLPHPCDSTPSAQDGQEVGARELLLGGMADRLYIFRAPEHVNKAFLGDVLAATANLQTDNRLIADPEVSGSFQQPAYMYLFSEPIDNSLRALLNTPNVVGGGEGAEIGQREIAIFAVRERLPPSFKRCFEFLIFYDNGRGMGHATMREWMHRGITPLELAVRS